MQTASKTVMTVKEAEEHGKWFATVHCYLFDAEFEDAVQERRETLPPAAGAAFAKSAMEAWDDMTFDLHDATAEVS